MKLKLLTLAAAIVGASAIASATPMGVNFNVGQCAGGGVTVTTTQIIWSPVGSAPGTGCIVTGIGTNITYTGATSPLVPGEVGDIQNLAVGGGLVPDFMVFPPSVPGPVELHFNLADFTNPNPSFGTNCAAASVTSGSSCIVVAGSPVLLTFQGFTGPTPTTTISLGAFGTVCDSGGCSAWGGGYSTQQNLTPGQIQAAFFQNNQFASTYSGQFTLNAIPEPASMFLLGGGLLGIAILSRRRARKA